MKLRKEAYKSDIGSARLGALDVKAEDEPYQYHALSTSPGRLLSFLISLTSYDENDGVSFPYI